MLREAAPTASQNIERTAVAHPEHRPAPAGTVWSRLRAPLLYAIALSALLAVVHPEIMFGGKVYGSADAANSDAFALTGDAWLQEHGDYPEWNPYLFGGMPTFGSTAYRRWVYPVGEAMTWLQNSAGFPPSTWLLAHMLFGGAGMIWLLGSWGLPPWARLLGAACWLLFPKTVAWAVHGHGSKLVAAMYLPWIVGWTFAAFEGRARRAAGWLALLVGLQFLRGHPQITYYIFLAVGIVAAGRWIAVAATRRTTGEPLPVAPTVWGLAALAAAFLVGAVSLLPQHDYAAWSVRGAAEGGGASYAFATNWSLSPRELGSFLFPAQAGFGQGTYQGAMPFNDYPNTLGFMALILTVAAWGDRRRWVVRSLFGVLVMAVLVSFGKHFPVLYNPFYELLPYFNKFRTPSMILTLAGFAVAVLAAVGAGRLVDLVDKGGPRPRRFAVILIGAGVLLWIGALGAARDLYGAHLGNLAAASGRSAPPPALVSAAWGLHRADLFRIGCVLAACGGGVLIALRGAGSRRGLLGWLLCVLVIVELVGVDLRITHPERSLRRLASDASGRTVLVASPALISDWKPDSGDIGDGTYSRLADALGHERVWPLGRDAGSNAGMIAGVRSLGGYSPVKLAAFETVRQRLYDPEQPAARLASWLGAVVISFDQVVPDNVLPALASLGADLAPTPRLVGDQAVYTNRSALPRARLVHTWRPIDESLEDFLDLVQDGRVHPQMQATLDREPVPAPVANDLAEPPVEYLLDGLDEVVLRAAPTTPAILVLADMNHPGWSVTVDGQPGVLLSVDHILRGVALPAGDHEVRFVYHDPSLRRSLMLSFIGLALASILLFIGVREKSNDLSERTDAA